ncbi:hypothetical protein VPH35_000478 [Triticum aestivum]
MLGDGLASAALPSAQGGPQRRDLHGAPSPATRSTPLGRTGGRSGPRSSSLATSFLYMVDSRQAETPGAGTHRPARRRHELPGLRVRVAHWRLARWGSSSTDGCVARTRLLRRGSAHCRQARREAPAPAAVRAAIYVACDRSCIPSPV